MHLSSVGAPALQFFLCEAIPLARAMGVGVEVSNDQVLVLSAPKEQNRNSLNTAFGGSLVTLATLAGYGVVWELMQKEEAAGLRWSIVIKESQASYRRPVLGDLRAVCERPALAVLAEFKDSLARYGQARLNLRPCVMEEGKTAVDVKAVFVVRKLKTLPV